MASHEAHEALPAAGWLKTGVGLVVAGVSAAAAAALFGLPIELRLLLLAAAVIALSAIPGRMPVERRLHPFDVRALLGPPLCILTGIGAGVLDWRLIGGVIAEKLPIIMFILSFAYLCAGVEHSGYFEYAAYTVADRCRRSTARLIVSMFLLNSLFTAITSNDVVVLAMTPITLAIARAAEVKNARILLLSQFIAANTLSMALYTGSPTNIIVSQRLGLNFFSYFALMAVPSIVALIATLGALWLITHTSRAGGETAGRRFRPLRYLLSGRNRWEFNPTYTESRALLPPVKTPAMSVWLVAFWVAVAFVAVSSLFGVSLLASASVALAAALAAHALTFRGGRNERVSRRFLAVHLPYGILPFGLAMFTITEALSHSAFSTSVRAILVRASGSSFFATAMSWGATAGGMVNLLNDLPASDLLAQLFAQSSFSRFQEYAALQATLVAVNIGTYLTPIGALAGLIWVQTMKRAQAGRTKDRVVTPELRDLMLFGLISFVITFAVSMTCIAMGGMALDYFTRGDNPPPIDVVSAAGVGVATVIALVFFGGRRLVRARQRAAIPPSPVAPSYSTDSTSSGTSR